MDINVPSLNNKGRIFFCVCLLFVDGFTSCCESVLSDMLLHTSDSLRANMPGPSNLGFSDQTVIFSVTKSGSSKRLQACLSLSLSLW